MPLAASLNLRANGVVMETMTTGARDDEILVRRQGREGWEPLERPLGNAVAEAPLPLGPARDPKTGFPFRIEKDPQGQNMSTIDWRAANPISDHPAASISVMDRMRMAKFTDSGKWDDYVGSEITEVVNGLLEDSSSDEDDENVQVGRVNKGEHMGPKYGAVDPEYSRDRTTNLDQGKEWHGRMEDQYTDEQVNLVEGTAGQEMMDEW